MGFIRANKHKIGLIAVLLAAACLYLWGSWNEGWSNGYYSAAVKSMLTSWSNFFFVSYDPTGFVSVDKPALGLWIECLFALVFGLHGWVLILPQALASMASVFLLYKMLQKPFGKSAALLASLFLAVTPIFTAVSRTNNLDATLILSMLLASYFLLKALDSGKYRFFICSIIFVGLGFNIKMVQAYMILPSIYLCYMLFTNSSFTKRILNLMIATVVLVGVSLSWCIAVDLTPKDHRPYVGSSTYNNALDLALGYNGIMRISGPPENAQLSSVSPQSINNTGNSSSKGFARLLNTEFGGQIGWLLPLALIGIFAIVINNRKLYKVSFEKRISFVYWGSLFIIMYIYFSFGGVVHTYYTATIAPSAAVLCAIGLTELRNAFNSEDLRWKSWLLPLSMLILGITQFIILKRYSEWNSWLPWVILCACVTASLLITMSKYGKVLDNKRFQKTLIGIFIGSILVAPVTWSLTPAIYGSNANLPMAGPELSVAYMTKAAGGKIINPVGRSRDFFSEKSPIFKFVLKNYNGEKYLVAMPSAVTSSMMSLETDKPIMAVGGFTGIDKILTVNSLKKMIANNELRYFVVLDASLLSSGGGINPVFISASNKAVNNWVKQNGKKIPTNAWIEPRSSKENIPVEILQQIDRTIEIYDLKGIAK